MSNPDPRAAVELCEALRTRVETDSLANLSPQHHRTLARVLAAAATASWASPAEAAAFVDAARACATAASEETAVPR